MLSFISILPITTLFLTFLLLVIVNIKTESLQIITIFLNNRRKIIILGTKIVFILFLIYSIYIISLRNRTYNWYLIFALITIFYMMLILLSTAPSNQGYIENIVLFITIAIFPTLSLISLGILGFVPYTSDEGRFTGYAYKIIDEGRWIPYKYVENTYYQFFHVIPYMEAVYSIITHSDVISFSHTILIYVLNFLAVISLIVLTRNLFDNKNISLLAPLLLYATPTLEILSFIPRKLSEILIIFTFMLLLCEKFRKIPTILIIFIIGIITHPTYILILTVFLILKIILSRISHIKSRFNAEKFLMILILLSITYWLASAIFRLFIIVGSDLFQSFFKIFDLFLYPLNREIRFGIRTPWYLKAPVFWSFSWSFLPSMTVVYLFVQMKKLLEKRRNDIDENDIIFIASGFSGLILVIAGYLVRFGSSLSVYIGYLAYILFIFPSSKLLYELYSKRKMNFVFIFIIIIIILNIAVQDYAYSPDYSRLLPTPTKESWEIGKTISGFITGEYTKVMDREVRLSVNVFLIRYNYSLFEFYNKRISARYEFLFTKARLISKLSNSDALLFHTGDFIAIWRYKLTFNQNLKS